jgi:hypothetical protein
VPCLHEWTLWLLEELTNLGGVFLVACLHNLLRLLRPQLPCAQQHLTVRPRAAEIKYSSVIDVDSFIVSLPRTLPQPLA